MSVSIPAPVLRRTAGARARSAILWGLAFFLALQLGLAVAVERRFPELRDPEYGAKLTRLLARRSEEPGRPLLLALGSSRTSNGLSPLAAEGPSAAGGGSPLLFNFGLSSSGPVEELFTLRRLLAEGVRPDGVVIEVLPLLLGSPDRLKNQFRVDRLSWGDLALADDYAARPGRQRRWWAASRLVPWFSNRYAVMSRFAHGWLPMTRRQDFYWAGMDGRGWQALAELPTTGPEYRRRLERVRNEYGPCLDSFRAHDEPDRALRQLLELCRRERIAAVLVLMPESDVFRGWCSPAARVALADYLAGVSRAFDVPVLDAREWVADEGAFLDSHHLLPRGARTFSERFGREVLPLLRDRAALPPCGPAPQSR